MPPITFNTGIAELVFVTLPDSAEDGCEIRGAHPGRQNELLSFYGCADAIELPPGQYELLGLCSEVKREDVVSLVPSKAYTTYTEESWWEEYLYKDFEYDNFELSSPLDSFLSICTFLNLLPDRTVVLKKVS